MEYTVYVLQDKDGNLYKGMTNDLRRRLLEHKSGKTHTTRRMHSIEVVYTEVYSNKTDARKRELYFKTAAGRRFLKTVVHTGL